MVGTFVSVHEVINEAVDAATEDEVDNEEAHVEGVVEDGCEGFEGSRTC